MTAMDEVRPMLNRFREVQERKLEANVHKSHWRVVGAARLLGHLLGEVAELVDAMNLLPQDDGRAERVREEAADVANFAAMIADCFDNRDRMARLAFRAALHLAAGRCQDGDVESCYDGYHIPRIKVDEWWPPDEEVMSSDYTCADCGKTYPKGWSDKEAAAESERDFPGMSDDEAAVVCDDCYLAMQALASSVGAPWAWEDK